MDSERTLHERVAQKESHEAQTRGVVGWFYRMYIDNTREFLTRNPGTLVLDIGCGEGVILRDSGFLSIQLDISMSRLRKARAGGGDLLICADGKDLPFPSESFDIVLLIGVLEHVHQPEHIVDEMWRVLKKEGKAVVAVPNDVWMSLGRLLLFKWPPRYPGHLSWISPRRIRRMAEERFAVEEAFALPFKRLPFELNMSYRTVLRKL